MALLTYATLKEIKETNAKVNFKQTNYIIHSK